MEEEEKLFWVDIPDINSNDNFETWVNVATFNTEKEALKYAQRVFGADEKGRINLVTG